MYVYQVHFLENNTSNSGGELRTQLAPSHFQVGLAGGFAEQDKTDTLHRRITAA
jgi:hypothetical protein